MPAMKLMHYYVQPNNKGQKLLQAYHTSICTKIQVYYNKLTILCNHLHSYPCHYCWQMVNNS